VSFRLARPLLAVAALAVLAGACTKEKESLILVSLTTNAPELQLRKLTLSAEGVSKTYDLPAGLTTTAYTYGMYVPSEVSGSVDVTATAQPDGDCTMGYAGTGRTTDFKVGEVGTATIMLKGPSNVCGAGGTAGGAGTMGSGGRGGGGGTGPGGSSGGGCTGTLPPAGTPPTLKCCTEYDHLLTGEACDANDTYIYNLSFSPDGKLLITGGNDGRYVFWNFDGKTVTPEGHNITGGAYGYAAFSPDGTMLAAGGSVDVHVFGVGTWSDLGSLTIDSASYGVFFAPDGQRVVDADASSLYVHTVGTPPPIGKTSLDDTPWAIAVSPAMVGGALGFASVSTSGYATVYNITGQATFGTPITFQPFQPSTNELWAAAFSPSGTQLAVGGYDSLVGIWKYPLASATDQPVISFSIDEPARLEDVNAIAFSPNGRYLAVAGGYNDGSASIWDLTTTTRVGRYPLASRYALSVAFSPSGNAIAVGEHGCGKFLVCTE
jgi:WD40 repeat protein